MFKTSILFTVVTLVAVLGFAKPRSPQDSLALLAGVATGDTVFHDYAVTNISAGVYTEVNSGVTNRAGWIEVFDSSGRPIIFATGAAGSETDRFIIMPGGHDKVILDIIPGTRIAVKAYSTGETISSGNLIVNFFGQSGY